MGHGTEVDQSYFAFVEQHIPTTDIAMMEPSFFKMGKLPQQPKCDGIWIVFAFLQMIKKQAAHQNSA